MHQLLMDGQARITLKYKMNTIAKPEETVLRLKEFQQAIIVEIHLEGHPLALQQDMPLQ